MKIRYLVAKFIRDIKYSVREFKRRHEYKNRNVAQQIGEYYLMKNNGDYEKTREEIIMLGITQIETKGDGVIITLQRCGLLIGRRGENIEALKQYLSAYTKYSKINIKEDKIISWIIPHDYSDYEDL